MFAQTNLKGSFYFKNDPTNSDSKIKNFSQIDSENENFSQIIKHCKEKLLNFLNQCKFDLKNVDIDLFKRYFKISFSTFPKRNEINCLFESIIEK